jgi:hypothetical protein
MYPVLGDAVVEWRSSTRELMVKLSNAPSRLYLRCPDPGAGDRCDAKPDEARRRAASAGKRGRLRHLRVVLPGNFQRLRTGERLYGLSGRRRRYVSTALVVMTMSVSAGPSRWASSELARSTTSA